MHLAVLAQALKELLDADNEVRIIGTRHGEKIYETLVNREEMAKAIDLGDYYAFLPIRAISITASISPMAMKKSTRRLNIPRTTPGGSMLKKPRSFF